MLSVSPLALGDRITCLPVVHGSGALRHHRAAMVAGA